MSTVVKLKHTKSLIKHLTCQYLVTFNLLQVTVLG